MNAVSISLSDEQLNELQATVYLHIKEEIERAREDCRLEQVYMTKKKHVPTSMFQTIHLISLLKLGFSKLV